MCDIVRTYARGLESWHKSSAFYKDRDDFRGQMRSILISQIDHLRKVKNYAGPLVLKDPNFVIEIDHFADLLDGHGQIIAVVRDPRDIASSFIEIGKRQIQLGESSKYTKRNMDHICQKILTSYEKLVSTTPADVTVIRYEDFVADPKHALQRLGAHLGWPALDLRKALEVPEWLDAKLRHQPSWISELEGGAPSNASVGRFATVLSKKELEFVEAQCSAMIEKFHYAKPLNRRT